MIARCGHLWDGMRNEVQVVITILSLNPADPYDVLAINAASRHPASRRCILGPVAVSGRSSTAHGGFPTHGNPAGVFDMVGAGRMVSAGPDSDSRDLMARPRPPGS